MKKILLLALVACTLHSCCWSGDCRDDDVFVVEPFESAYEPVILSRQAFEESVQLLPPKEIINSGKIYVIGDLLFVNEKNEGFHIFGNSDPSNPIPLNFIETPGATDIAIKNGVYYINQAVDLIAITYNSRSADLNVSKRIRDIFPILYSPEGYYPSDLGVDSIVVDWRLKTD